MATLTKKKALYVRGANNIYYRKDAPSPNATSQKQHEVELLLNELMECGFQVESGPAAKFPDPERDQQTTARALDLLADDTIATYDALDSMKNLARSPLPLHSTQSARSDLSKSVHSSQGIAPESTEPYGYSITSFTQRLNGFMPLDTALSKYVLYEKIIDKGVPFLFGMAATYIIQVSLPSIAYYSGVVAHLLKLAFIWAAVLGAIFWYAGFLNTPDLSQLPGIASKMSSWLGQKPPTSRSAEQRSSRSPSRPVSTRLGLRSTSPLKRAPFREHRLAQIHLTPDLGLRSAEAPFSEPLTTNVRPFISPMRDVNRKIQSEQKLLSVRPAMDQKPSETSILRSFIPRKPQKRPTSVSAQLSLYNVSAVESRRHSALSVQSDKESARSFKPLPPVIQSGKRGETDLPLAYEVKLRTSESDDDTSLMDLDRLETVLSKKSVLGTRANYAKFLANVN